MNLNNSCRDLYNKDKKTSSVAKKIEAGEAITTLASMSLDTASWIITKGEGMGQRQYTNFKTVGARDGLFLAPSWNKLVSTGTQTLSLKHTMQQTNMDVSMVFATTLNSSSRIT